MPDDPYMEVRVRVSVGLSCGCAWRALKEPVLGREAIWPGRVVFCDEHDEYAIVTRVTSRLVAARGELEALLRAKDVDAVSAAGIVSEQFPDLPD